MIEQGSHQAIVELDLNRLEQIQRSNLRRLHMREEIEAFIIDRQVIIQYASTPRGNDRGSQKRLVVVKPADTPAILRKENGTRLIPYKREFAEDGFTKKVFDLRSNRRIVYVGEDYRIEWMGSEGSGKALFHLTSIKSPVIEFMQADSNYPSVLATLREMQHAA